MRVKLTNAVVEKARHSGTRNRMEALWDTRVEGLGLRVYPSGKRSYIVTYREGGKKVFRTLGPASQFATVDLARDAAQIAFGTLRKGEDPFPQREAEVTLSFGDLAERFMEHYARPKLREWEQLDSVLKRPDLVKLHKMSAHEITLPTIVGIVQDVQKESPFMADKLRSSLSRVFNWGMSVGLVESNPLQGMRSVKPKGGRERVLTPEELVKIHSFLLEDGSVASLVLRARMYTVQRTKELTLLRDEYLDNGWFNLPGTITKNRKPHRVFVAPLFSNLLAELYSRFGEREWIFPAGNTHVKEHSVTSASSSRLSKGSGVTFQARDLRRTGITYLAEMGVSRDHRKALVNHTHGDIHAVYDRYSYDVERRQAMLLWDQKLQAMLNGEDTMGKVVNLW